MITIALLAACVLVAQASLIKREVSDASIQSSLQSGSNTYLEPDSKADYDDTVSLADVKGVLAGMILHKIKDVILAVVKLPTKVLHKVAVIIMNVLEFGVTLVASPLIFIIDVLLCKFTTFCYY